MKVTKQQNGSDFLFEIEGSIDSITAPELNDILNEVIKGAKVFVLDFKKVDYVSSAGLRVLLAARKTLGKEGNLIVRHPNKNVLDIFTMTGFDNILTIEE